MNIKSTSLVSMLCAATCSLTSFGTTSDYTWLFAIRGAFFRPSSSLLREIYGNGMTEIQGEVSRFITGPLHVWATTAYATKTGCSVPLGNYTRLQIIPTTVGLKVHKELEYNTHIYAAAGGVFTHARIDDDSEYVKQHLRNNSVGLMLETGFGWEWAESGIFGFFADYSYQKMRFLEAQGCPCPNLNLSGYKVGARIGLSF